MSIITKITLTFSLLVFLISSLVGFISYQANNRLLEELEIAHLQRTVQAIEREFAIVFEAIANDVLFLSDIPAIKFVAEYHTDFPIPPPTPLDEQQLIACSGGTFLGFLQNRDNYTQVRFIGHADNGREVLRVEHCPIEKRLKIIAENELQAKGERYYFKETLKLAENELYLSPIDLNREEGELVEPHEPTVRVATPVYSSTHEVVGMLIINVSMQRLFAKIVQHLPHQGLLYIANEQGDYLMHPDSSKAFAFEFGQRAKMQDEFPFTQALVDGKTKRIKRVTWQAADDDAPAYFAYFSTLQLNPEKFPTRHIHIGFLQLHDSIAKSRHRAFMESVRNALILCLIGIGLTFMFAVYLTRPLKQITEAVLRFSRGDQDVRLSLPQNDEIGELARTCQKMADQIRWQLLRLRDEKNYLQIIFDTAVEGIVVINDEAIIESVNHTMIDLCGYSERELLGNNVNILMPQALRDDHDRSIQNYLKTGHARIIGNGREVQALHKDGRILQLHLGISELWIGHERKFVGMMHDISAHKKAEQAILEARDRAEAANRAKSQFLANMSHEFRTPLNGILGYTQLLRRDNQLQPKHREHINVIHRSGEHLLALINDILDLSKIEAEHLEILPIELDFLDLVKDIGYLFKARAEQKGIAFICKEVTPLPKGIYADGKRLRQVLLNLLGNAIKFTQQGSVTFQVGVYNGTQCFDIIDTGIGIPDEDLDSIFKPFHQVEQQHQHTEGTGLGLAITRKLVDMMNGHLQVESQEGQGSHFHLEFQFPILQNLDVMLEKAEERQIIGCKNSIHYELLLVDDKQDNRNLLSNLLLPLGFKVREAENGELALEQLHRHQIDLVLMDLFMPVMDGFSTAQAIRANDAWQDLPIIAVSAGVFAQQKQQALAAGCNAFLEKPVQAEELLQRLQKYLKLEWEYAELEAVTEVIRSASDPELVAEYLPQLQQYTRQGDIQGVLDTLKKVPTAEAESEFFARVETYADNMDLQALRRLLEQYSQ